MKKKISIVIPCFNEGENVRELVRRIKPLTELNLVDCSFCLVDNGSIDGSLNFLSENQRDFAGVRVVRTEKNLGYGGGISFGLRAVASTMPDYVGWMHSDLQTTPEELLKFFNVIDEIEDADLIKGSRFGRSFVDIFFTKAMSVFELCILGNWMDDINSQPNLVRFQIFKEFENLPNDFSFDLAVFYSFVSKERVIRRIPVYFGPRFVGFSSWNTGFTARFKFIRRTLSFSWALRRNRRSKKC